MPRPDVILFGAAALTQFVLALAIWSRRPTREWRLVLGGHLLINVGVAIVGLASQPGRLPPLMGAVYGGLDIASAGAILYLALAFPERPGWLQHRAWLLPTLIALPLLAYVLASLAGMTIHVSATAPTPPLGRLLINAFPALAWVALLGRWTVLLLRQESPVLRRQFTFIYGAYAVRAAHVAVLVPLLAAIRWENGTTRTYLWIALPAIVLELLALLGCLGLLARAALRSSGTRRTPALWALGFLAFGALEAVLSVGQTLAWGFHQSALVHVDVFVIRPILLWIAIFHFDAPKPSKAHVRLALGAAVTLAALALWAGTEAALQASITSASLRSLVAILVSALVTAIATVVLTPRLLARLPAHALPAGVDIRDATAIEAFLARAEDEHRDGPPNAEGRKRLAAHADRLGLEGGQAAVLEAVVASGWAVGTGAWTSGQLLRGRYRLQRPLGQGAWGETWRAGDEWEKRQVVLKRTARLDDQGRRAILTEWEALRHIRHPRVIPLLGVERLGREPILVFPRYNGSLEDVMRDGPVPERRVLTLLHDPLEGLAEVHRRGLVHGDLKPSNVFLDDNGRAVLADFGSTHALPGLGDATLEPASGGTLAYMAPEQAQGKPGDAKSDQYSAALVAWALLMGRPPLPDGLHPNERLRRAASGFIFKPPPKLSRQTSDALRKALQPNPAKRFQSVGDFMSALGRRPQDEEAPSDLQRIARDQGTEGAARKT